MAATFAILWSKFLANKNIRTGRSLFPSNAIAFTDSQHFVCRQIVQRRNAHQRLGLELKLGSRIQVRLRFDDFVDFLPILTNFHLRYNLNTKWTPKRSNAPWRRAGCEALRSAMRSWRF